MEHPELVETAAVNYLLGLGIPYWDELLLNGETLRIFPGESSLEMDGQSIVCYIDGDMQEEEPPTSSNRWCDLVIRLKTPSVRKAGDTQLKSHKANADALQRAILDITLPAQLTQAPLNDFTGLTVFGLKDRQPFREQDATGWISGWKISLYSCPQYFAS